MIDTQSLRTKILDLAMRGQLTEQLPEDGTAEELYQQIQAEKQALIKAGKIKKEKPLPEITEGEKPFAIPESWKWVRIGSVFKIEMGQSPEGNSVSNKGDGIEFHQGKIFFGAKYLNDSGLRTNMPTKIADANSVLLCVRAPVGKVNISSRKICIGRGLCAIAPISNTILLDFLYYALIICEKAFVDQATGSTFAAIGGDIIKKQLVPLPPLREQKRIVQKVIQVYSALDTIDELQTQYADNLTVLKSKLIDAAIQGKLTEQLPEDGTAEELYRQIQEDKQKLIKAGKMKKEALVSEVFNEPYDIPNSWKWVRLGSVASVLGGKRIPAGRSLTQEDTGHKYIRISDMKNNTVQINGLLFVPEDIYPSISQYIINKEDVYITVAGTIGRVGKIPPEIDGANLTENADRIVFSHLNQDWLIICLSASVVQKQIEYLTTSVAQPKLAIKRIQEFLIPLPPIAEQKRIVARLDQVLATIEV